MGLAEGHGPANSVTLRILQLQPGLDGGKARRRMQPRSYRIQDGCDRDALKWLLLNILLYKARHPG